VGPEIANVRAIIGLLWPTVFLAKMSILNTVHNLLLLNLYCMSNLCFVNSFRKYNHVLHVLCVVNSLESIIMYSEVSNKRTAGNKSTAAKIHSQNWTNFLK